VIVLKWYKLDGFVKVDEENDGDWLSDEDIINIIENMLEEKGYNPQRIVVREANADEIDMAELEG
jgi:hypothetical protein